MKHGITPSKVNDWEEADSGVIVTMKDGTVLHLPVDYVTFSRIMQPFMTYGDFCYDCD